MTISFFKRRTIVFILLTIFMGAALLAPAHPEQVYAQGGDQGEPTGRAYLGQRLFEQHCVQCHGPQGRGDGSLAEQIPGPLPDFTAADYGADMSPQEVFDVITQGRMEKMMMPFGDLLNEEERWDLTAYVWSLHFSPETIDKASNLYEEDCSSCHGPDGAGVEADAPDLNDPKWLGATDAQLIAAITSETHPDVGTLSADEQHLAAVAVRRFSLGFDQAQVSVEGAGDIDVRVENGSTGAPVAHHPVRLILFEKEQFVEMREGETDDQGYARFAGLPTTPDWAYVAETTYQGLNYHGDVGQFTSDSDALALSVSVYDPGAARDAVSIDRAHWLVDISNAGFVGIGEVYSFLNVSDHVYAGEAASGQDKPRVLEIPLPADAIHVSVEGETLGDRFLLEGSTLIDTQPLPPGNTQIFLHYSLPVEKESVTLSHPILYPTAMLNLLAPDIGFTIDAPDWQQDEPIQTQGGAFLNYSIFDLPAGASPAATLKGVNADLLAGDAADDQSQTIDSNAAPGISGAPYLPWVIAGLGLIILGGGVIIGWRKHKQTLADAPALREEQKTALIQGMAALDDAYEAGEIDDDAYHQQRNTLKLQLIALMHEDAANDEGADEVESASETPKIHPEEDESEEAHGGAAD
jgi:mono/diheme cytochrome c family protein